MSFAKLGVVPIFERILSNNNIQKPTPIQEKAIPAIFDNKDVLGIAKTGSGKTISYALPIVANLSKDSLSKDRNIDALVLVPTRELANQVKDVFQMLCNSLPIPIQVQAVYGGVALNPQMKSLYGTNVLIATPGRLIELVEANAVKLDKIKTLVLDEADKMLNQGFKDEMKVVFGKLPVLRQNLLFSATLSDNVKDINQFILRDPVVIKIDEDQSEGDIDNIEQLAFYGVEVEKKGPLLRYIIKENDFEQVLVFASSVHQADIIDNKLNRNGIKAMAIHGKKSQGARNEAIKQFKNKSLQVLVATDILSRGIDIDKLPCVINYDLPRSPKEYIHRIGRTGRAEAKGVAYSLITEEDEHHFKVIQKKMKRHVTRIDAEGVNLQGY